jgi:hypothetical protein
VALAAAASVDAVALAHYDPDALTQSPAPGTGVQRARILRAAQ